MIRSDKVKLFEEKMYEYTGGKPTIITKDIGTVLGLPKKEITNVVKDLSYFGKRTHAYVIEDVAEALVEHMHNKNDRVQGNKIIPFDQMRIKKSA